jgi:hypothetical protein
MVKERIMKKSILLIGRHPKIMETILRLINNQADMIGVGALTDEQAIEKFQSQEFELVLFGGGVDENSENELRIIFETVNPKIKMVRHYGGGSGLLFNEITEAFS